MSRRTRRVEDSGGSSSQQNPNPPPAVVGTVAAPSGPTRKSDTSAHDIHHFFTLGVKAVQGVPGSNTICLGCQETGIDKQFSYKTSYTTLRSHLENAHGPEYLRLCTERGWKNQLPSVVKATKAALIASQSQDPSGQDVHQREPFSREKFVQLLAKFIVATDQSIDIIERPAFRDLLLYLRPNLELPSRSELREIVIAMKESSSGQP